MAERLTVAQEVVGSKPIRHPIRHPALPGVLFWHPLQDAASLLNPAASLLQVCGFDIPGWLWYLPAIVKLFSNQCIHV